MSIKLINNEYPNGIRINYINFTKTKKDGTILIDNEDVKGVIFDGEKIFGKRQTISATTNIKNGVTIKYTRIESEWQKESLSTITVASPSISTTSTSCYWGDKIKIIITPSTGYEITSQTITGIDLDENNEGVVTGDISINIQGQDNRVWTNISSGLPITKRTTSTTAQTHNITTTATKSLRSFSSIRITGTAYKSSSSSEAFTKELSGTQSLSFGAFIFLLGGTRTQRITLGDGLLNSKGFITLSIHGTAGNNLGFTINKIEATE